MTVGDYVKQYRMAHGMSQRQFAAKSGLSSGYISMLEANRSPRTGEPIEVSLTTLKVLCDAMGVTISDVLRAIRESQAHGTPSEKGAPEMRLTAEEWKLVGLFRNAEPAFREEALQMLKRHPMK